MNRLIYRKLLRPGVPAANRAPKAHAAVATQMFYAPQRTHTIGPALANIDAWASRR
jgi:hypothetical protein